MNMQAHLASLGLLIDYTDGCMYESNNGNEPGSFASFPQELDMNHYSNNPHWALNCPILDEFGAARNLSIRSAQSSSKTEQYYERHVPIVVYPCCNSFECA